MQDFSKGRIDDRQPTNVTVHLMWRNQAGEDQYVTAKALDVSKSGLRVQLPYPLEPRSLVTLQSDALGLRGSASVRYCTRKGVYYTVGLEFTGGMFKKP